MKFPFRLSSLEPGNEPRIMYSQSILHFAEQQLDPVAVPQRDPVPVPQSAKCFYSKMVQHSALTAVRTRKCFHSKMVKHCALIQTSSRVLSTRGLDFINDEIYFCFLFFLSSQNKLLNTRAFGGAAGSGRTYWKCSLADTYTQIP